MFKWTLCCSCALSLLIGDALAQSPDTDALDGRRDREAREIEIDDDGDVEVDEDGDTNVSELVSGIFRRIGKGRRASKYSRRRMKHQRRYGAAAPALAPVTPASREEPTPTPAAPDDDDVLVPPLPLPKDAEGSVAPVPLTDPPAEPVDPVVGAAPPVPMSFRDRLLARRLALIDRMRASSADPAQQQQIDYLEGMVLQLHEQGLMTFAQKFIGSLQQGDADAASDVPAVDVGELDLGEAAPLPLEDGEDPFEPPPPPAPEEE